MIVSLGKFIKKELWPRKCAIFLSFHSLLALVAFFLISILHFELPVKATDVCANVIAYSAIAIGFCLTGFTLSLAFPDYAFLRSLALREKEEQGEVRNAYSDLMFVFLWTAFSHWVLILFFVGILVSWGKDIQLLESNFPIAKRIFAACAFSAAIYSFLQFLITVLTLSSIGRVFLQHLKEGNPVEITKSEPSQ